MKSRIEYITLNKNSEPIVIENLEVFQNSIGHWIINFNSLNHKYLEQLSDFSSGCWVDGKLLYEKGIEFGTYETFVKEEDGWFDSNSFMRIDSNGGHFGKIRWSNSRTAMSFFGKVWFGEEKVNLWNRSVQIILIPETEKENEQLNGTFFVLPLKWCYEIAVIPYDYFQNPKYIRKVKEFEVVN